MSGSILASGARLRRTIQLMPHRRVLLESSTLAQTQTLRSLQHRFASTGTVATKISESLPPAATSAGAPRNFEIQPEDEAVSTKNAKEKLQRAVKKQLQYLGGDPWKIAKYVEAALAKDRIDEALLLTQTASRSGQVVVAWNHIIDYLLEIQELKQALKMYNDMKKRAQLPTVQTYTILFRGLAKSRHPKIAVHEAVKHYQKLLRDDRLEPNSIHLNAVLNVCNKAGDLDSMFSIVDTINESTRAPTAYTYTTIINALRHNVLREVKDLAPEQKELNIQKAISRGKAVWQDTIDKWRRGRLTIDEELVCAMGRLLLLSPQRDQKIEILDLLEQTMNIPNMSKRDAQPIINPTFSGPNSTGLTRRNTGAYATPGCNTLALVLSVVASSRLATCGIKYWNSLVREFKVVPDMDAWMRMFGMLKVAKSSAYMSEIISVIPDEYITPRHYCIAMETCIRDNINPNAIKNADRILDSMMERLEFPDPHALRLYLRLALVSHYELRQRSARGDSEGSRSDYGRQITTALARLWDPYMKLHNHYFKEVQPRNDKEKGILYNNKREVIALARIMYGAFNKVTQQSMLPENDLKEIRPIGARINREIHKFFSNREELEPNLRRRRGAAEEDMDQFAESKSPMIEDGLSEWDTRKPLDSKRRYSEPDRSHNVDARFARRENRPRFSRFEEQ